MLRITESLLMDTTTRNVDTSSSNYQNLANELSTGKKLNQPSDDPAGAAQALDLNSTLANITQYTTNANYANSFLSMSDSTLNSVGNLMTQARQIALSAANGATQDPNTQAANSAQITAIIQQITNLANSDFNGQRIFAGTQTSTNPYTASDPNITANPAAAYKGDGGNITVTVGSSTQMTINTPGDQIFTPIFTALASLQTDINAGNASAISNNDLQLIDTASNEVNQTRASIGSKVDQLTSVQQSLQTASANYQNELSNIQDADMATLVTNLQVAQNVYQASLISVSKAFQYSLTNFIQ
jgi:flagellar hook-associated protein 3 FlgL